MKRNTTGERARRSLRGHWAQALAWEGAVLCGVLGLMAAQGIAAATWRIPMAIPTPAFVQSHPALICIAAGGLLADLFLLSPVRFGRTTFYVKRASAELPFALLETEPNQGKTPEKVSLFRGRHGKAAIKGLWAALRRLWHAGRYRRLLAGRLLWWGWNLLGAVLFLATPAVALWLSGRLPDTAAPYPFYLTLLAWLSSALGVVLWVWWSLRLSPLMVLLAAHPSWRVRVAARRALDATRGRTRWLIRRALGFFGWFFTCAAVIPIAYVQPMYATAQTGWLLSAAEEAGEQKASCKAKLLYMRRTHRTGRRLIWPAIPAGQIRLRRGRAE